MVVKYCKVDKAYIRSLKCVLAMYLGYDELYLLLSSLKFRYCENATKFEKTFHLFKKVGDFSKLCGLFRTLLDTPNLVISK